MKYWQKYHQIIQKQNSLGRYEFSALFANPTVFRRMINDFNSIFPANKYNKIAALDAQGFIIGAALAYKNNKPFIMVRKFGKTPYPENRLTRNEDGKKKGLEIQTDKISNKDNVLIVDEWIETGSQVKQAIKFIEKLGGSVIGIATLGGDLTDKTKELLDKYNWNTLFDWE